MKKILFVGNSYTYYNDMPQQLFAPMAAAAGLELEVTAVTRGGWTLEKFADPENEEGQRLRAVIAGQHYDYVVLQEQSCRPVTNPEKFYAAVRELQTLLVPQAERFLLYATWGRKPGNEKLLELGLTNEEMTEQLAAAYDEAGRRFGMPVAHAGYAFAAYRTAHPEEELYNPDGSHPSLLGSEIAAETILTAILNATKGITIMAKLGEKRLFLLDMDGTIYLDEDLFPGTKPFLADVKRLGGRYLFLTNNSSKSVKAYVEKLGRLGIEAMEEDFLTSVDAIIDHLKGKQPYRLCYVFGTESFRSQLEQAGIPVTNTLSDEVDCLLIGFDTELTFKKLEDACILLNRGVDFIATNPDWVCPTWYGSVPDCGSVCEMLFRATGRRPLVIGKPQPTMVQLAVKKTGYAPEEAVMIGDRLYTDVASGVNAGIDTIFVLSGEGTLEDLAASDVKPAWTMQNISEVHSRWLADMK